MEIFRLFGSIFINSDEAEKSISRTEEKAESLGSKLGNGIKTAAKWGTAIVGGATAAAGGLMAVATKTAATTDRIDKLSQKIGLSRQGFQEWEFILSQSGTDIEKLQMGMKTLVSQVDQADKGVGKGADNFARLGISVRDATGNLKDQETLFNEVMVALQNMEDGTEKARLANELLGRSGSELMPLLNGAAGSIDAMKQQAHDLGLVISDDVVDAGVLFTDTMDQLKRSFGAMATGIGASVFPMVQQFAEFIIANMPMIQEVLGNVMNSLSEAVSAVLPFLMDLIQNALPPMIDLFSQIASDILPPVITLFTQILQAVLPPLIELFSGIITTILPPLMDLLTIIIENILPPFIDLFNDVISAILPPLMELFSQIIDTLLPPLIELFSQIIDAIMPVLIDLFNTFVEVVLPPLMELIDEIVQVIMPPLLAIFNELAEIVLPLVMTVFEAMLPVIEPIMNTIADVIRIVLALIKGDWEEVWNGIESFFSNIWDTICKVAEGFGKIFGEIFEGIKKVVLGVWDGIVDGIKKAINWVIGGINTFIRGLNKIKIPDWVPVVGGKGINIKEIPTLAEGGEILRSGRVIVGEAGPEMLELPQGAKVKPLDRVGEGIDYERLEAIAYTSFFEAFVDAMKALGKGEIRIDIDGRTLAREMIPRIIAENQRMGVATT
jgi:phage-related protein